MTLQAVLSFRSAMLDSFVLRVVELLLLLLLTVVKDGSKSADYDWERHLVSCLTEAENFQPPSEIFAVRHILLFFLHTFRLFYLHRWPVK